MGHLFNKVNKEVVIDNFNEVKDIIIEQINQLLSSKDKIINYIDSSYNDSHFSKLYDIYQWKTNIINYINYIYDGQDKEIEKIFINKGIVQEGKNKNKNKPPQKVQSENIHEPTKEEINKNLVLLTSKDIQIKLGELTREFESYSGNFINDDEQNEKILGQNLLNIANISRYSYNQSNNYLRNLYKYFENDNKEKEIIISSPDEIRIQFYFWFKNNKNQTLIKSIRDHYIANFPKEYLKNIKQQIDINYIKKLNINLFDLYFQSKLSFPPVEIKFLDEKEVNYDSKRMIDFFDNRIKGIKKINFEYFPSFYSNETFLENGKHWVFTYRDNKNFNKNIHLLKLENNYNFPNLGEIISLDIVEKKYLVPKINYRIKEGINYEYHYFLSNKRDGKIREKKSNLHVEIDENEKLVKCDFILMNKCILTFKPS